MLVQEQIALLGMKSMGDKNILKSNTVALLECLQYALSRPTAVVIKIPSSAPQRFHVSSPKTVHTTLAVRPNEYACGFTRQLTQFASVRSEQQSAESSTPRGPPSELQQAAYSCKPISP